MISNPNLSYTHTHTPIQKHTQGNTHISKPCFTENHCLEKNKQTTKKHSLRSAVLSTMGATNVGVIKPSTTTLQRLLALVVLHR